MKKLSKSFDIICRIAVVTIVLFVIGFIIKFIHFSVTFVSPQEQVINSIGENECVAYYSGGVFQDFTDYAIYSYSNPRIEGNENFSKVTDTEEINTYLDDFQKWVDMYPEDEEIRENYNFDRNIIDESDYVYIADRSTEESDSMYEKFDSYDFYIYDSQSKRLYYFHNNI